MSRALTVVPLVAALALGATSWLLSPAEVHAAEQTGTIRGRVTDASGKPLQGALVSVASPDLQGVREAKTGPDGTYWLPGLPPGAYDIQASLDGFRPRRIDQQDVAMGSTATIDLALQPATVETTVVVEASRPVVDTRSSTSGSTVTKQMIDDLPVGRSYQSAARLAAGVVGGANPNVKGGASNENKFLLNGANTTDPVTGTFSFNFANCAIKEIEVKTGNFRAEDGGVLGGVINVRTESGSDTLHGGVKAYYNDSRWSPKRDAVYTPNGREVEGTEFDRDSRAFTLEACAGGPVVRKKLWAFAALTYNRVTSTAFGSRTPRIFDGYQLFAKLTATPHRKHRLELSLSSSPAKIENTVQGSSAYLVDPDAQGQQAQDALVITGEWNAYWDRFNLKVGYDHLNSTVDVTPVACTWKDDDRFKACKEGQEEGYIDFFTPARLGSAGARTTANFSRYSLNRRYADSVRATGTLFVPRALGSHEVKAGVTYRNVRANNLSGRPGNIYYFDRLDDAQDPNSTIEYYWVEVAGPLYARHTGDTLFVFLQDTWEPLRGLTIDAGVKYDHTTMRNDEGERIVGFDSVTPVAGLTWDPSLEQKAKVYVGGGLYIDEGRLGISSFLDKNGTGHKLFLSEYFDGRHSNYSFDAYSHSNGQSTYDRAEKLTFPRTYALTAGFQSRVSTDFKVGMEFSGKWMRNLWEDDETNYIWNSSGTNTIGVINGQQDDFFRLRTPVEGRRNYYALTFNVARNNWKKGFLDLSYTISLTRGLTETQITAALDNPTQEPYEYGWLSADRPHVVTLLGGWETPIGLLISGELRIESGSRFDRQYSSDKGFGGYAIYQSPIGNYDSINTLWYLDLLVKYRLKLPVGRIELSAELSNVTNNRYATGISGGALNASGEYFAAGRQAPMSLELGVGYVF